MNRYANKYRVAVFMALLVVGSLAMAQLGGYAPERRKEKPVTARELVGQVMEKGSDAPVAQAVVYLKNTKTTAMKTFIVDKDGNYRFAGLAMNVDYEVFAELEGKRSDTKTLSAFDTRAKATINLRIDSLKK